MDNAAKTPADKTARRTMGLVFLTVFMDFVGFSILFPLGPQLVGHYFATEPQGTLLHGMLEIACRITGHAMPAPGGPIPVPVLALFGGLLGALFSLLQFWCAPLWGKLSDRVGRRPVLLTTLAGTALAYALWLFAGAFWVVVVSRILAGVMAGNISVAQAAAADSTTGNQRSRAMALIGMAIAAGILCGPALGAIAAMHDPTSGAAPTGDFALNPFSWAAGASLLVAALNLALAFFAFRETHAPENRSQIAPRGSVFQLGKLRSSDIRRATLVNLCFFTGFAGMESTLTFVALDLFKYTPKQNALMFVFIAVSMGLIQGGVVRRMGSKIGEVKMTRAGLAAGLLAFLIIAFTRSEAAFYLGLFLFATASALTQPSLAALVSLYSNEREQGFHAGIFRSAGALARAIGPLAAAILYFHAAGHAGVYVGGALITLVPLLIAAKLTQPRHDAAPVA